MSLKGEIPSSVLVILNLLEEELNFLVLVLCSEETDILERKL